MKEQQPKMYGRFYGHWTKAGFMAFDPEERKLYSPLREGPFVYDRATNQLSFLNKDSKPNGIEPRGASVGPVVGLLVEEIFQDPEKFHSTGEMMTAMWGPELAAEKAPVEVSAYMRVFRNAAGETTRQKPLLVFTVPSRGVTLVHPDSAMSINSHHATTKAGEISVDENSLRACSPLVNDGLTPVQLRGKEAVLLRELIKKNGGVVTRHKLRKYFTSDVELRVYAATLRDKLDKKVPDENGKLDFQIIKTEKEEGYRLAIAA